MKARGQPKRNEDIAKLSANEGSRKFISSNKTNNHEDLKKHQPRRSNQKEKNQLVIGRGARPRILIILSRFSCFLSFSTFSGPLFFAGGLTASLCC